MENKKEGEGEGEGEREAERESSQCDFTLRTISFQSVNIYRYMYLDRFMVLRTLPLQH